MSHPLSVLLTNNTLRGRTGTETATRDMALTLRKRGNGVQVYSPALGPIAEELIRQDIPVSARLSDLPNRPDIIHGHHHDITVAAALFFRDVPGIFVCHDARSWYDHPPALDRIRHFVAVDFVRRDRLLSEPWMSADAVTVIPNGVDIDRFQPRKGELPAKPRRALIFNNQATSSNFGSQLFAICCGLGLSVDVMGAGAAKLCECPENYLPGYDLVFAVGRCALEAIACGCACILCDSAGIGPLVTAKNVLNICNFNFGCLHQRLTATAVAEQVAFYDPMDAAEVQQFVRNNCSLEETASRYEDIYRKVLDDKRELRDYAEDARTYAMNLCRELASIRMFLRPEEMRLLRSVLFKECPQPYPW